MVDAEGQLERLVQGVLESAKYRRVCVELIRGIGARELAKRRSLKEAVKATKNVLHQVGGAYQTREIDYAAALEALRGARQAGDALQWREECRRLMGCHASTRERLSILAEFYATTLGGLGPIRSVLDLACGLNPLAIPWMPLAPDAEYHACDIYGDMVGFLNGYLALTGVRGGCRVADVTRGCPPVRVQVALLLKSLPCLEQLDSGIGRRLLEGVHAEHVLVSFPVHSLGGRRKGMVGQYEGRIMEWVGEERNWTAQRFVFSTELVFRLTREGQTG